MILLLFINHYRINSIKTPYISKDTNDDDTNNTDNNKDNKENNEKTKRKLMKNNENNENEIINNYVIKNTRQINLDKAANNFYVC